MNSLVLIAIGLLGIMAGWAFHSRFIANRIYRLDPDFVTPAHQFRDGVDYVPTNRYVLWGHHFTSVADAAAIRGGREAEGERSVAGSVRAGQGARQDVSRFSLCSPYVHRWFSPISRELKQFSYN